MIICENCFSSAMIRQTLGRDGVGVAGYCPTCGQNSKFTLDTERVSELAPELIDWFGDLISKFDTAEMLPPHYPKRNRRMLNAELKNNWNIFSNQVDEEKIYDILTSICSDLYGLQKERFDQPVAIAGQVDPVFLQAHSLTNGKLWDEFVDEITHRNRYHARTLNLEVFERVISHLRITLRKETVFYRCRLTDGSTPYSKDDMGAPPKGKSTPGRANAAGITCLYLASDIRTAIAEVRAGAFDHATVAEFRLKQDIPVIDFRAIQTLCPLGIGMDYYDYIINREHLKRIDMEMGRGLKRGDHSIDYVATQYITDFVKSLQVPDETGNLQDAYWGIIYNSTLNQTGYNLAIFREDAFECISAKLVRILSLNYQTDPRIE